MARWIFLPVLGAAVLHAPVLRFDLLRSWKRPIDGGRAFRGRRLLGVSTVVGELPNSFAKRQLGIAPGTQRNAALSLFDQADFVLAAWLLLRPVYRMSAREAAEVFAIVAAVHVPINVVGRLLGVRSSAL